MVANLLDGVNHTKDDLHMWLAPFTPSHPHIITISFSSPTSLAMIRVWVSYSHHLWNGVIIYLSLSLYLRTTTSLGSIPTVEYGTWRCGWMNNSSSEEKSEGKSPTYCIFSQCRLWYRDDNLCSDLLQSQWRDSKQIWKLWRGITKTPLPLSMI